MDTKELFRSVRTLAAMVGGVIRHKSGLLYKHYGWTVLCIVAAMSITYPAIYATFGSGTRQTLLLLGFSFLLPQLGLEWAGRGRCVAVRLRPTYWERVSVVTLTVGLLLGIASTSLWALLPPALYFWLLVAILIVAPLPLTIATAERATN